MNMFEYQEEIIQKSAQRFVQQNSVPSEPPRKIKVRGKWVTYSDDQIQAERNRRAEHNKNVREEANKTVHQRRAAAIDNNFTLDCLGGGGGTRYIGSDEPVYGSKTPPSKIKGVLEFAFILISAAILAIG